jgi:hypothetical protein
MATYDTEQQRIIDRIKCIAFREAHDDGATFINQSLWSFLFQTEFCKKKSVIIFLIERV